MFLDPDVMKQIAEQLYIINVQKAYGSRGIAALRRLLTFLPKLYSLVEPEEITGKLIACLSLDEEPMVNDVVEPLRFTSLEHLAEEYNATSRSHISAIEFTSSGDWLLWKQPQIDITQLSKKGIVYIYHSRREYFVVNEQKCDIPNPNRVHASVWSIPTYRSLSDALEEYKIKCVRNSSCPIFETAWESDERLFLRNKPEHIMRNSLTKYLKDVLRGAEIRPEQNVDDSHPVDIKVTWMLTNRLALIEIKWLGASVSDGGSFVTYHDGRARSGARQLAEYLDANRTQASEYISKGFLVVIDARRRNVRKNKSATSDADRLYYSNQEIRYNPQYHVTRNDFSAPIRMFAEPKCSLD